MRITEFMKTHRMRLTALLNQYAEKKITHQKMYATLRKWEKLQNARESLRSEL